MKAVGIIGTATLFLLLGTTVPAPAQQEKQNEEPNSADKAKGKGHAKAATPQQTGQGHNAAPQGKQQQAKQQEAKQQQANQQPAQHQQQAKQQQANQRANQQQAKQQEQAKQQQANQQQAQQQNQRQANQRQAKQQQQANQQQAQQQAQQQNQRQANQRQAQQQAKQQRQANQQQAQQQQAQQQNQRQANQRQANQRQVRLSQARQQQLIAAQQQHVVEYRQHLDREQPRAQQYSAQLQREKRTASYRFQQDYAAHIHQQQLGLQRSYDYDNDPYFYTASSYRYSRGGSNYETNQYGADMLHHAINNGYAQGYLAGQADREDRWASDYRSSYAYQDASYGYNGYAVDQTEYSYYFREGFNRGYQDGYSRRTQYGRYSNGSRSILGSILLQILTLQSMH